MTDVQGTKPTSEQEKQLREILGQIGPVNSMQFFSQWLQQQSQGGHYGTEFKDTINRVVVSLNETTGQLRGQSDSTIRG